ncbi:MAG: hypothetical protein EBV06_16140 [Planctomycetia bacterium]|nr:hypothetical protein [Planctomycetia bacterium]
MKIARRLAVAPLVFVVLTLIGCGSDTSDTPKTGLNDRDKEQIKQYQEVREQEWGGKTKKKK